jgi:hypothetical protein
MKSSIALLLLTSIFLTGCGSATKINKDGIRSVKNIAVVIYSVPPEIKFKKNPKEDDSSGGLSLMDVAKSLMADASKADGIEASEIALNSFIKSMNNNPKMTFKVLTPTQMAKSANFTKLVSDLNAKAATAASAKANKKTSMLSSAMSFLAPPKDDKKASVSPKSLVSFGLIPAWGDGNALRGTKDEQKYVKESLEALGVDAILALNDMGYSFLCSTCVGGTGTASTGSAFHATLIGANNDVLLQMKQWFNSSDETAATTAGIVNPLKQKELFKAHGEKLAKVFAEQLLESMNEE